MKIFITQTDAVNIKRYTDHLNDLAHLFTSKTTTIFFACLFFNTRNLFAAQSSSFK